MKMFRYLFLIYSNKMFTTKDQDNDGAESNCAVRSKGAWGPFLESPGNFTGPKSNIQIKI